MDGSGEETIIVCCTSSTTSVNSVLQLCSCELRVISLTRLFMVLRFYMIVLVILHGCSIIQRIDEFSCWDALPSCFHHKHRLIRVPYLGILWREQFFSNKLLYSAVFRKENPFAWQVLLTPAELITFSLWLCHQLKSIVLNSFGFLTFTWKFQNNFSKNRWQTAENVVALQAMQHDKNTSRLRRCIETEESSNQKIVSNFKSQVRTMTSPS